MAKKQLKRKRIGVGEVIWFLILCLLAFLIIYPLCWILMSSFKDYQGIYGDVWGLPKKLLWSNYVTAWNKGISLYFVNQFDRHHRYLDWRGVCCILCGIWCVPD